MCKPIPTTISNTWLWVCLALAFCACSPEATGPIARFYHNLNAHYNGYFLARQLIDSVEYAIFLNRQDQYLHLLPVYPEVDSNQLKSFESVLKDAIRKAAFTIERHPNSRWTEHAYLVVGKARFYLREYENATNTFKYLNAQGKNPLVQDIALIELMRTYIMLGDLQSAEIVKNYLRKQGVAAEAQTPFYLVQAFFYQKTQDTLLAQKSLELALPQLKSNPYRARLHYLHGQLYQLSSNSKLARKAFEQVSKHRPDYLLSLMAKLQLLTLTDLRKTPYNKVERSFERLLRDEKNREYHGPIYYARAQYWLARQRPQQAKNDFSRAAQSAQDPLYKGYSYYQLAQLHYEQLRQYRTAKAYYDSTLQVLPKTESIYARLERRTKVLEQFVRHIETIELEDSLQLWAQKEKDLSPEAFDQQLTQALRQRVRQQIEAEEARQRAARQAQANMRSTSSLQEANQQTSTRWYFDDPITVARGRANFRQKWGNRPLSDHWRVASKANRYKADELFQSQIAQNSSQSAADPIMTQVNLLKTEFLQKLPRTEVQRRLSHSRIENALFNLGKIYHFQLLETQDADRTYRQLLDRYPDSQHKEEVFYLRYLLHKEKNPSLARQQLTQLQRLNPQSIYLKLIEDPNYYQKMQAQQQDVEALYRQAFQWYERQQYAKALEQIRILQEKYPENHIKDKSDFLVILCLRALNQPEWLSMAESFVQQYPNSELAKRGQQLIAQNRMP